MPSTSPSINSFNAGEFSPLMMGQTDFQKWKSGCKKLVNFIPRSQGPAERRGGTYFVNEVKSSANRVWLAKFEYNTKQAFILEFGPEYIRFYSDHGVALDSDGTPLEIKSPYIADDLTNDDGGFGLSMVQSGDVIYICCYNGNKPPYKLSRISNTNWTLTQFDYANAGGPFETINSDRTITVYTNQFRVWSSDGATRPDGTPTTTSLCTITASAPIFSSGDAGGLFYIGAVTDNTDNATVGYNGRILSWEPQINYRPGQFTRSDGKYYEAMLSEDSLTGSVQPTWTSGTHNDGSPGVPWRYSNGGWGVIQITSVTSATVAVGKIIQELPPPISSPVGKTYSWAFGEWSNTKGFPSKVSFYKSRLVFAGRNRLWFSVASDFENFTPMTDGYQVQTDDGINVQIEADSTSVIQWMASGGSLIIGTASSELTCSPSTANNAFGPENIQIVQESKYGSKGVNSVIVGNTALFVQRAGRKLRAVNADYQSGSYSSIDLSVLAEHITSSGIVDCAWQQEPDYVVWVALSDGSLVALTYNAEQEITGWHRHDVGGIVEAVATIPDPDGNRDDLWMVVRRTINGASRRYVEYLRASWDALNEPISQAFYVDCGLTYSGPPVTSVSGLSHLEGMTVSVIADGAAHPDQVVKDGRVSLQWSSSIVHVGLPYTSELVTLPLEAGGANGTSQGKTKRTNKATIRFVNTLGGKVGDEGGRYLDVIESRDYSDLMDQPPGYFTDDRTVTWPGGYNTDACLRVVQDQPLPMTVCAIYPRVWTTGE